MNYYLIIATIIAILPIILIKKYIMNKQIIYLILSLILYFLLLLSYIKLFETEDVSSTYTILQILQILIIISAGLLFFNEPITSNKILGIVFGLLSIYLLNKK